MTSGSKSTTDVGGGHIGLVVTIIALVVIASFSGPCRALIVSA